MHDAITVGIPIVAILFGILLNQKGLDKLDSRMDRFEGRMDRLEGRMDRMQSDLSQFYQILGNHGARIEIIEKKA